MLTNWFGLFDLSWDQGLLSWLYLPPNSCASCVSEECLVAWSKHVHKQKCPANLWNMLVVSAEFPAFVSVDSLLTVSRAIKLGPGCHGGAVPVKNLCSSRFTSHVGLMSTSDNIFCRTVVILLGFSFFPSTSKTDIYFVFIRCCFEGYEVPQFLSVLYFLHTNFVWRIW